MTRPMSKLWTSWSRSMEKSDVNVEKLENLLPKAKQLLIVYISQTKTYEVTESAFPCRTRNGNKLIA